MDAQPTTERRCPRCGAVLPHESEAWERVDLVAGRAPAYRNRHEKPGGKPGDRKCAVFSGGELEQEEGAGI